MSENVSKIEFITKEWEKDSAFDSTDILAEINKLSALHSKYLSMLGTFKRLAYQAEIGFNNLKLLRNKHYKGLLTKEEILDNGFELDPFKGNAPPKTLEETKIYFNADVFLSRAEENLSDINACEELIKSILNFIQNGRAFSVRNFIDIQKLNMTPTV